MNVEHTTRAGAPGRALFGLSPWLLIGLAVILGLAITVLSVKNTQREKGYRTQNMMNQAEALIWALEAGTRTWMGMRSGDGQLLQTLVRETAKQPGIVFIAVADDNGRMVAHSDPARSDSLVSGELPPLKDVSATSAWRLLERDGKSVFEVYRTFAPSRGDAHGSHWQRDWCGPRGGGHRGHGRQPAVEFVQPSTGIVVIGLDQGPFEEALAEDFKNNLLSAVLVAALALAGFISLFWAHNARRSRRLLRDSQAMSSEVVGNLPLGLVTTDPAGTILSINDTALTLLHAGKGGSPRASLCELPGIDWEGVVAELGEQGKILDREMSLAAPGGKTAVISLSAAAMRNDDGVLLGNLFILRDITEMKQMQAEAQRNDRLAALGTLAAGVAHEIRNPLSTIKGVATYIAKRVQPGGREHEAANTMITEVDRLDRVVSELLEFARPGSVATSEAGLPEVVNRALRLADADVRAKNITVHIEGAPGFPPVFINPERFTQALLNLILNAVQAMAPGGELTIAMRLHPESNTFSVAVRDTGPGIPENARASLFTPYFTTKPSGTGLGLAIVHQIVEGHGGTIRVDSVPGSGAEFTISLPLKKTASERI